MASLKTNRLCQLKAVSAAAVVAIAAVFSASLVAIVAVAAIVAVVVAVLPQPLADVAGLNFGHDVLLQDLKKLFRYKFTTKG